MQDLTTGSVTRHLLKTTSFMLVTMVFQTLYFLVDLYWVGRLGKEAVAAVAVAGNLTFIVLAATQMLSVGTTTLISHASGRKDHERANVVFNQSLLLGVASALIFLVVAWTVRGAYAAALSADPATARLASDYLAWFIPAMSLQFPMVSMASALRGTGNFKPGMIVQTFTVIVNIVLAPMLIFGWPAGRPAGVAGAAIATFVAVLMGTFWLSLYFRGTTAYLHFRPGTWIPRMKLWWDMLKVGLPAGAEFALMAVYLFIVYTVSRRFGSAAQAGFGIGLRIVQACFLPVVALGIAVAPVAGQNFGARQAQRVRDTFRSAATMATAYMLLSSALCLIAPAALIGIFSDDPEVIAVGNEYLRIVAWNYVASGVVFVASSMFQAVGNTIPPLVTSFGRMLVLLVPVILLSRLPTFELAWIWYLSVGSVWLHLAANVWLLRREFGRRLAFAEPSPS
ncbi:MAG: MATE family efflux transporter, partial [Acidobacteria bacterium]|nr:MATE family efflux transporter [Acidobacteriota bacterium]